MGYLGLVDGFELLLQKSPFEDAAGVCGSTTALARDARIRHAKMAEASFEDLHRLGLRLGGAVAQLAKLVSAPAPQCSVVVSTAVFIASRDGQPRLGVAHFCRLVFVLGVGRFFMTFVPSPSCPWLFSPQHQSVPFLLTPQLWRPLTDIDSHVIEPKTFTGMLLSLVVPSPNAPAWLLPQHHRTPSFFIPQLWSPTVTCHLL